MSSIPRPETLQVPGLSPTLAPRPLPRIFAIAIGLWFLFAFVTKVNLIPGMVQNIGPFEFLGAVMFGVFLASPARRRVNPRHPLIATMAILLVMAAASQVVLPPNRAKYGMVQVAVLAFLLAYLTIFSGLTRRHRLLMNALVPVIVLAALAAGAVIVSQGVDAGIEEAGIFRGRAHMATYMLTSFWLCLIGFFWPLSPRWVRLAAIPGLAFALYCVAISGRRSAYLALFAGLAALGASVLVAQKGKRLRWLVAATVSFGVLIGMYSVGSNFSRRTAFFQARVHLVDDRLRSFLGTDDGPEVENSFYALQRQGVRAALLTSPLIGIGWGGFAGSEYSPTGHEIHSTPLRFLAELGVVGFALYLAFMGFLLAGSARLFLTMRASPYGNAYLALAIAIWSMSISYVYNRHITERTFWIFLAVYLAMEAFAEYWQTLNRASRNRAGEAPRLRSVPPTPLADPAFGNAP